jgi:type III pantothenate kinase
MLLAIDIGNSTTAIGLFDKAELKSRFRISSVVNLTAEKTGSLVIEGLEKAGYEPSLFRRVVVSSVVPGLTSVYESVAQDYFHCRPLVVGPDIKLPVTIDVDNPREVGPDRIVNVSAGFVEFGGPLIVVDIGTATTFDVVTPEGIFIGGVIIPGPETAMTALADKAARLFDVRLERPETVLGKSTESALISGLFYGSVGQVDFIIEKLIEETGFDRPSIIATGGLADTIGKSSRLITRVDSDLTLRGLRHIADMNTAE